MLFGLRNGRKGFEGEPNEAATEKPDEHFAPHHVLPTLIGRMKEFPGLVADTELPTDAPPQQTLLDSHQIPGRLDPVEMFNRVVTGTQFQRQVADEDGRPYSATGTLAIADAPGRRREVRVSLVDSSGEVVKEEAEQAGSSSGRTLGEWAFTLTEIRQIDALADEFDRY